ncbi:unnamed protein product (macronuclear) [Paramecium tetraurelia]|uniref:Uncharacterized protein n=1 Tax=Paramecium tetraurelia TaxID=5888 RepID=A0DZE2_PARTE|nr:uncharacterized protein GSPATT00021576001 [Paramecium tetraurelia]CAK88409.1 unnamed protein product [Paramecium tetraurelia]|eukprot:XP_001455806.1 hypothetical protein (macronuclear) [Paramecium tetraurelia strain d4-2]
MQSQKDYQQLLQEVDNMIQEIQKLRLGNGLNLERGFWRNLKQHIVGNMRSVKSWGMEQFLQVRNYVNINVISLIQWWWKI